MHEKEKKMSDADAQAFSAESKHNLRSIDTDTDTTWDMSILETLGHNMVGIRKLIGFWYYVSGVSLEMKKKKKRLRPLA